MSAAMADSSTAPGGQKRIAIVFVVAAADNDVIGRDGALPWRLKSDMQHFRALTMGKPVIMGRKTFHSIGKPLVGRTNIVVSRDPSVNLPGAVVARSLSAAVDAARGDALRRSADSIMVVGGAEIFAQALPLADRLELTRVHLRPDGDVLFPPVKADRWREVARKHYRAGPGDDGDFTILTYVRTGAASAA